MSALSPSAAWAVGGTFNDGDAERSLIEQWDGTAWRTLRGPGPGTVGYSNLSSITTDGAGSYWAVGSYSIADGGTRTLSLHCP